MCVFEVLVDTKTFPDTKAVRGDQLTSSQREWLQKNVPLDPGEEIRWFYAGGMWSIEEDGQYFTNRRVVTYERDEAGKPQFLEALLEEVESIDEQPSTAWYEDTSITVATEYDVELPLLVSAEDKLDRKFIGELRECWQAARNARPPINESDQSE